jgi:hypothetical protein
MDNAKRHAYVLRTYWTHVQACTSPCRSTASLNRFFVLHFLRSNSGLRGNPKQYSVRRGEGEIPWLQCAEIDLSWGSRETERAAAAPSRVITQYTSSCYSVTPYLEQYLRSNSYALHLRSGLGGCVNYSAPLNNGT